MIFYYIFFVDICIEWERVRDAGTEWNWQRDVKVNACIWIWMVLQKCHTNILLTVQQGNNCSSLGLNGWICATLEPILIQK